MTLTFIPTAFAEENLKGDDANDASLGGIVGGWNDFRCGYRMYVVNQSNTSKSPVLDIWFTKDLYKGPKGRKPNYGRTRAGTSLASDWAGGLASNILEGDMPTPWSGGRSNAEALRGWLLEVKDGEDTNNAERAMEQVFGEHVLDEFRANQGKDPYYLCIEPLANFAIYDPSGTSENPRLTGYDFKGTFFEWCEFLDNRGWKYGGPPLKTRTNTIFAYGVYLEKNDWTDDNPGNLKVPPKTEGFINCEEGLRFGYGIAMYRITDITMNGLISTYDEPMGTNPAPAPKPETDGQKGIYSIVKVYATQQSDDPDDLTYDGCYTRLEVCKNIDIEDEPEYKVREWHVSRVIVETPMPFGTTWPICKALKTYGGQEGTGTGTVVMDFDNEDRTLFVLLVKPTDEELESDLIIQESEISIYRQMSEVNDFNLPDRKIKWLTDGIPSQTCDYQVVTGSYQCETPETCTSGPSPHNHDTYGDCGETIIQMEDKSLKFKAKNTTLTAYKNILATEAPFKPEVVPKVGYSYSKTTPDPESKQYEFDYKFVVYRGSDSTHGKDDLTLSDYTIAKESLSFENSPVKALDKSEGTTPGTRKRWAQTEKASIDFPVTLKITLKQDDSGDYRFSGKLKCGHQSAVSAEFRTNEEILAEAPVTIHSYSGKPKTPSRVSGSPQSYVPGCHKGNGYVVNDENLTLSFYPYIRMTYETMGSNTKHDVNVLSQHKREMTVSDYAEAGYVNGGQTLSIQSQQWSVHQLATNADDDHPWAGRNKVLPGGAIYNVKGVSGGQTLKLRTYQVVVGNDVDAGAYKALVAAGSTGLAEHTVAKAEAAHQAFVESCLAVVNNGYYIEQVINNDPMAELSSLDGSGWTVVNRDVMSAESKYYLNNTSESVGNIQSAILQATAHAPTKKLYTFYSDTSGNVYMDGTLLLEKGEGISKLPSGNAKEINKRTKVVTNLIGAIERNTGDDPTASWVSGEEDGAWYNEAFSVTILVQETSINVNLTNPTKRETVLDPKLCPTNLGKSDYFSKARASAYRMSSTSILAESLGKGAGYIGTFKETDISISNITGMFRSNTFIIPNVNVQDLKH